MIVWVKVILDVLTFGNIQLYINIQSYIRIKKEKPYSYRTLHNYGNTHFIIVLNKNSLIWNFLNILMTTIILNKYQHHLFNFSSLVFNNSLQSTLDRKLRTRHAAFLGKSSSILVASSPFNLSSDCLFSTLTWSSAYFPCLIELFQNLVNSFTANR